MKYFLFLLLAVPAAVAQTGTASVAGTVLDAKTLKPVPAALVMAIKDGAPPFSKNTKTGADGAFQIQALPEGKYSLCVQAGDGYLDPCQWNGTPATVTLASGQAATGISPRLAAASIVSVQVRDEQKILSLRTKDGRRPELRLGVWGPNGLYYPARGNQSPTGENAYVYRIGVPRDTAVKLDIGSRDLKLGDARGVAIPGNISQHAVPPDPEVVEAFRGVAIPGNAGHANPKSFTFTVLGLLP